MSDRPSLVLLLHGIGATGAQLMPLAQAWRGRLPGVRFSAPDAPLHHWRGRQWFSTDGNPLDPARMLAARAAFDDLVADVLHQEGFAADLGRVAFVGVSQGAIVALDAVASGRWKVGALVAFSGLLAPQPISGKSNNTPVLLVHGKNDITIPAQASVLAAAQLRAAGFNVEIDVEPGVGHTISPSGAERAMAFLKRSLFLQEGKEAASSSSSK